MKKTLNDYFFILYKTLNAFNSFLIFLEIQIFYNYYFFKRNIFDLRYLKYLISVFTVFDISNFDLLMGLITILISLIAYFFNETKNNFPIIPLYSRFANKRDIRLMEPSVTDKNGLVIGSIGIFKKRTLKAQQPLGVLCVAPAGAGKTTGTVIPTILSSDKDTLIINDPKGELYAITSAYRKTLGGKVSKIEWGEKLELKNELSASWNPLALENIPVGAAEIMEYVEILVNVLISDTNTNNQFWTNSSKKTLGSIMLYLISLSKIKEIDTTITACKELLSQIGIDLTEEEEEIKKSKQMADMPFGFLLLSNNVIALEMDNEIQSLCSRVFLELSNMANETLQSIVASVDSHLNIFNNLKAVKTTSKNTIKIQDIRGEKSKPNTIYLISPAAEQKLYGVLSALFVELAYRFCTSENYKTINKKNIVRFILDEVAFFPKINAVSDGSAIGRGYRCSFLLICQDLAQLRSVYGEDGLNNIFTNSAYKIILPQNNDITAKRIAGMVGNKRIIEYINEGKGKKRKKEIYKPLIEASNILHMPKGKQLVLIQNNATTPIFCDIPFWFKNADMSRKIKKGKTYSKKNK